MDAYRIAFYTTKLFNLQHVAALSHTANHFHVLKNNKKIAEHSKLWKAINVIIDDIVDNRDNRDSINELQALLDRSHWLAKADELYSCVGVTFMQKHGVKLEMKMIGVLRE